MKITLTVIAGPHAGRKFEFEEHDNFIVGRSTKARFRLPKNDPYFSRMHFLVEVNPPLCRLVDLGSSNGTFVNEQRVTSVELKDGDLIQGGDTTLRVNLTGTSNVQPDGAISTLWERPGHAQITSDRAHGRIENPSSHAPSTLWERPAPDQQSVRRSRIHSASESTDADELQPTLEKPAVETTGASQEAKHLLPANYQELIRSREQPIVGYQIVDELGRGGMGVVYRAVRSAGGSVVALKTVLPAVRGERQDYSKFLREIEILRQLDHPRIVRFRDVGESHGMMYFAMDYVPGTDADRLARRSPGLFPVPRAVHIVCQLLEALEAAHAKGFVHRDIKPSNLLIRSDGRAESTLLLDFGLARTYQGSRLSGLTMTGAIGGTVPFMPPEQITAFREAKPAVDQYAAAATLYFLLTKQYVYDYPKEIARQLLMILQDAPIPVMVRRADLPRPLSSAIDRALAREPTDRFPDVAAFRQVLLPFAVAR